MLSEEGKCIFLKLKCIILQRNIEINLSKVVNFPFKIFSVAVTVIICDVIIVATTMMMMALDKVTIWGA